METVDFEVVGSGGRFALTSELAGLRFISPVSLRLSWIVAKADETMGSYVKRWSSSMASILEVSSLSWPNISISITCWHWICSSRLALLFSSLSHRRLRVYGDGRPCGMNGPGGFACVRMLAPDVLMLGAPDAGVSGNSSMRGRHSLVLTCIMTGGNFELRRDVVEKICGRDKFEVS